MWIYGWKLTTMPCLMVIGLVQPWETSNIYVMWLYKYMWLRDQVTLSGSSSLHITNTLPILVNMGTVAVEICFVFFWVFFYQNIYYNYNVQTNNLQSTKINHRDIILVYYVIKKDLIIKGSGHYNNRSPSR